MMTHQDRVVAMITRALLVAMHLPHNQDKTLGQMRAEASALFGPENVSAAIASLKPQSPTHHKEEAQ